MAARALMVSIVNAGAVQLFRSVKHELEIGSFDYVIGRCRVVR